MVDLKFGGVDCVAHETVCAAALLMGQTSRGIPVVIIRGVSTRKVKKVS